MDCTYPDAAEAAVEQDGAMRRRLHPVAHDAPGGRTAVAAPGEDLADAPAGTAGERSGGAVLELAAALEARRVAAGGPGEHPPIPDAGEPMLGAYGVDLGDDARLEAGGSGRRLGWSEGGNGDNSDNRDQGSPNASTDGVGHDTLFFFRAYGVS